MTASTNSSSASTHVVGGHAAHHVCLPMGADMDLSAGDRSLPAAHHKLHQFVFAGSGHREASDWIRAQPVPSTWLAGEGRSAGARPSAQILAVSGVTPSPVCIDGLPMGSVYEDEHARYCYLGGIRPASPNASREAQARSVFERISAGLATCGMRPAHILRTWFYLHRLLEWYEPFNALRTDWFNETGIFEHLVPASTGIGAANPFGAALTAGLLAVEPRSGALRIEEVASPLQCPALDYASSFSRAVALRVNEHRTVYVSGTASIDPEGNSVHDKDAAGQIDLTMRVVAAILESRGMTWRNAVRGIAYFKDLAADKPIFDRYCREKGVPEFPLAVLQADICRDELLFEIEIDAAD